EMLMERAQRGESVAVPRTALLNHFHEDRSSFVQDVTMELIARGLRAVRIEKDELYAQVAWSKDEVPATVLLPRFQGNPSWFDAMDRTAQRVPRNEAFLALYEHMVADIDNSEASVLRGS